MGKYRFASPWAGLPYLLIPRTYFVDMRRLKKTGRKNEALHFADKNYKKIA
jgi:hypothetical protein